MMNSDPAACAHSKMRLSGGSLTTFTFSVGLTRRVAASIYCRACDAFLRQDEFVAHYPQRLSQDFFGYGDVRPAIEAHFQDAQRLASENKGDIDVRIEGDADHLPPARLVTIFRGQPRHVRFRQAVCLRVFAVLRHEGTEVLTQEQPTHGLLGQFVDRSPFDLGPGFELGEQFAGNAQVLVGHRHSSIIRRLLQSVTSVWSPAFPQKMVGCSSCGPIIPRRPSYVGTQNWWRQGMMGSIKAQYDCIKVLSETEFYDDLKMIDVPVLVMHGEDDQICPFLTTGARSVKLLKHGTLKSYPGFPHGMPTTNADQINADILEFLTTNQATVGDAAKYENALAGASSS